MKSNLLDGMVVFTEVVDSGGFTSAAKVSGHSVSHLSKTINRLESRLGVRLLNRTTRTMSLTPEGEMYYQRCVNIIAEAKQVGRQLEGQQLEPQGHLRVSCPVGFGLGLVRPALAAYMDKHPKVSVEFDLDERYVDIVGEGYDVVFRGFHRPDSSGLIAKNIHRSKGMIVASPQYLNQYGTPVKPEELSKHKIISLNRLHQYETWKLKDKDGIEGKVRVKSHLLTNSDQMALSLCVAGQGITRLPLFALTGEIERGELVELFDDYKPYKIDIYLAYPSRKHISLKVRSFVDFMSEQLLDTMA